MSILYIRIVCESSLIGNSSRTNDYCDYARQLGGLGVLRGVIRGFSEEARTRGFPSQSFGGFGFVVIRCASFIRLAAGQVLIVNIIRLVYATGNVRFGSLADLFTNLSLMSALERKAVIRTD